MSLTDAKYIAASTYRRSGEAVTTATWVAPLDAGRFGFCTSSAAGKAKRLRNNPRITVQPSDARGQATAGTEPVEGTAAIVSAGPDFDAVKSAIKAKYGISVPISKFMTMAGHLGKGPYPYGDVAIIVTPSPATAPPAPPS